MWIRTKKQGVLQTGDGQTLKYGRGGGDEKGGAQKRSVKEVPGGGSEKAREQGEEKIKIIKKRATLVEKARLCGGKLR